MFSEISQRLNTREDASNDKFKSFDYNVEALRKTIMSKAGEVFTVIINENDYETKIVKFTYCPEINKPFHGKIIKDQLCLFCLNPMITLQKRERRYNSNSIFQCSNCDINIEIITNKKVLNHKYEELKRILIDICENYKKDLSVELKENFNDKNILIIKKDMICSLLDKRNITDNLKLKFFFEKQIKCDKCRDNNNIYEVEHIDYFNTKINSFCTNCKIDFSHSIIKIKELIAEINLLEKIRNIINKKVKSEMNIYDEVYGSENYLIYAFYDDNFKAPKEGCNASGIKCRNCNNCLINYKNANPDAFFALNCEFRYLYCEKCMLNYRNQKIKYYI